MNWITLVACVAVTSNVYAVDRTVSDIHITLDEWELVPTMIGTQVESFVGLRDSTGITGDNITAVWFIRGSGNTWQVLAWHDQDKIKSIAHVKSTLGLADSTDGNWPDPDAQQGVDPSLAEQPDEFLTGVFADDPFIAIIESLPEPGAFIEMLTNTGWSSANIAIQTGEALCTQDETLTSLAAIVEADIATNSGGLLADVFDITQENCYKWLSIEYPLGLNGTWEVVDLTPYIGEMNGSAPSISWQSLESGTLITGPQTVVFNGGVTGDSGESVVTNNFVVSVKDVTPPVLELEILGNGNQPLASPFGGGYFLSPVTITADALVTDNVDDETTLESNLVMLINSTEINGGVLLTEPGYYTLSSHASDSAGNTTYKSTIVEVRANLNYLATSVIESVAVTPIDSATDLFETTILLTSDQIDHRYFNLSTLALWLVDSEGNQLCDNLLKMSPGYIINGEYDSSKVSFNADFWRLSIEGEIPSGIILSQDVRFSITGSGNQGELSKFDFVSKDRVLVVETNPAETLLSEVIPESASGIVPEIDPAPICRWKSQLSAVGDGDDFDVERIAGHAFCGDLFNYEKINEGASLDSRACIREFLDMWASIDSFWGEGAVLDWCSWDCNSESPEVEGIVTVQGRLRVWLEGAGELDCCDDCTISVSALPGFEAQVWLNRKAVAAVAGSLLLGIQGCPTLAVEGAVAISDTPTGSFGIGGFTVPYMPLGSPTSIHPIGVTNCNPIQSCSTSIQMTTQAHIYLIAESTLLFWHGDSSAVIHDANFNLSVTPRINCIGVVIEDDDRPIYYNIDNVQP